MAENEAGAAVQEQENQFQYPTKVEDVAPGTKKVTIEIPPERISEKLAEQFKDLRAKAHIPGFRPGHAPQKLVEKKFASDVREEVRRNLISESYQQALEKNSINVIGEPQFDNPDSIKLPDQGALSFTFQVEVQPEFNLPELKGIKVKKPKIEVEEKHIDEAMQNLREQQGTLVPVEDRGVAAKDYITADVKVRVEGKQLGAQDNSMIVVRPGRVAGLQIDDLDKQLEGAKVGQTVTIKVTAPDTFANEQVRGKEVEIDITPKDIKKLELAEIDQAFLDDLGFKDQQELRDALREQMVERITADVQQAMREQVNKYLLENTTIELPAKLSDRQEARVINRRGMSLLMRGMPREQVEANIEKLKAGAKEEAARELRLFFMLQKIANERQVDVDEAELNGRIAMLAAQQGRRPEKLKQEMAANGSLADMYLQMREQKAVDTIIADAQLEEVTVEQMKAEQEAAAKASAGAEGEKK